MKKQIKTKGKTEKKIINDRLAKNNNKKKNDQQKSQNFNASVRSK